MTATAELLQERTFSDSRVRVDRESMVIRDVKVLGLTSQNGRRYKEDAVRDAVSMYENQKVYINHSEPHEPSRKFGEKIGVIRGIKFKEGQGLFGDLHYLKNHPQTELMLEMAERTPDQFGMSHDIQGEVTKEGDGMVVSRIEEVRSVDVVDSPATTISLFEHIETKEPKEPVMKTAKLKELVEKAHPKYGKRIMEIMDEEGMVSPDAEVEMADEEGEADPVQAVVDTLADQAAKVIKDPNVDDKETKKKVDGIIKAITDVKKKLNPDETPEEPSSDSEESDEEENEMSESVMLKAENMLLKAGKEATPERIEAVASVKEELRQKLVESWDSKVTESHDPPKPPMKSKHFQEDVSKDVPTDAKEFGQWLTTR